MVKTAKIVETEKEISDNGTNELKQTFVLEGDKNNVQQKNDSDTVNEAFAEFEKQVSSFQIEGEQPSSIATASPNTNRVMNEGEKMKLKMLVGFCCFILTGFNAWLFNMITKSSVPSEKIELDEDEQESLLIYLNSDRILNFINKLPAEIIMIAHVEFMFFQKHKQYAAEYKKVKPKKIEETKKE